jgi:transposase
MRYALTDSEWRIIQPILPNKPRGIPRVDDRPELTEGLTATVSGPPPVEATAGVSHTL